MMKSLLLLRFRALFASMAAQTQKNKKKTGVGTVILYIVLYLYVLAVICGMMGVMFHSLAQPYHMLGLDWLYFAMAAMMGLGFGIIGSVFTTQSQLYDAKDNALLLSMPISPSKILLSRMIPLLCMNLIFVAAVMVPAFVVYAIFVEFSLAGLLAQIVCLLGITLLAQAVACLLGWLLHLLLSKMNKSFASMLYMVVFLGIYFYVYSQANSILSSLALIGESLAQSVKTWVWPIYAAGQGCLENWALLLAFVIIALLAMGLVWTILSATFLKTATSSRSSRRKKLALKAQDSRSPMAAIIGKECRKFIGCPVYLTNMGLGIVMLLALSAAGVIFRGDVISVLELLGLPQDSFYLIILLAICYLSSTMCISTPSVSLEGKNLWILKSMPVSSRQILMGKLGLHCVLTIPVSEVCAATLCIAFGCGWAETALACLIAGFLSLLNGLLGMVTGLKWAKFDYISEAYPCKQSISVAITMFSIMGLAILGIVLYFVLPMNPLLLGCLVAMVLGLMCIGLYFALTNWGIKKWEALA